MTLRIPSRVHRAFLPDRVTTSLHIRWLVVGEYFYPSYSSSFLLHGPDGKVSAIPARHAPVWQVQRRGTSPLSLSRIRSRIFAHALRLQTCFLPYRDWSWRNECCF